ncbi:unnamed protein product [Cylindrotheca closterium]|uniref:Reverse transcriptase domain-containing protein n=1 Tax=Cylindrotheca closterium TaxID=2856 RepID=A0AAD2G8Y4_9STRA|nr:unnamed protein product [Cylindrotheca closterium]
MPPRIGALIKTEKGIRRLMKDEFARGLEIPKTDEEGLTERCLHRSTSVLHWEYLSRSLQNLFSSATQDQDTPSLQPSQQDPTLLPIPRTLFEWKPADLSPGGKWYLKRVAKLEVAASHYPTPEAVIVDGLNRLRIHRANYTADGPVPKWLQLLWWEFPQEHWEELRMGARQNFAKDPSPCIQPNAPMDATMEEAASAFVDELMSLGVVRDIDEGCQILTNAPLFVVPKEGQEGQWRVIADMLCGGQNDCVAQDPVYMPRISHIIDEMYTGGYSAVVDLSKFFYNFPTHAEDRPYLGLLHPRTKELVTYYGLAMGAERPLYGCLRNGSMSFKERDVRTVIGPAFRRLDSTQSLAQALGFFLDTVVDCGFLFHPKKLITPRQEVKYCGFLFDTLIGEIRLLELELDCMLQVVHVPGLVLISQGTDGLSRGVWMTPFIPTCQAPSSTKPSSNPSNLTGLWCGKSSQSLRTQPVHGPMLIGISDGLLPFAWGRLLPPRRPPSFLFLDSWSPTGGTFQDISKRRQFSLPTQENLPLPANPAHPHCGSLSRTSPTLLVSVSKVGTQLPVPQRPDGTGNKLHLCVGCKQGFTAKEERLECTFSRRGFHKFRPCLSVYHKRCFRAGAPFTTWRKGGEGLFLPNSVTWPNFVCEACTVRQVTQRELAGPSDQHLLMLERMRMLDTISYWARGTHQTYSSKIRAIQRFQSDYNVPILKPTTLSAPPGSSAIPLMWCQELHSVKMSTRKFDRDVQVPLSFETIRQLRSATSQFHALDALTAKPDQVSVPCVGRSHCKTRPGVPDKRQQTSVPRLSSH